MVTVRHWASALLLSLAALLVSVPGAARQGLTHDYVIRWSVEAGGVVQQPPVVVAGVVYLASQDGTLSAVDLDLGAALWSANTGSGFPLGPTVTDGVVYVANQAGPLSAFDAASGELLWQTPAVASIGSGVPAAAGGRVFVNRFAPEGGVLTALDAHSGHVAWTASLGRATHGSPLVLDGRVYVTGYAADAVSGASTPTVVALDAATGHELWRTTPEAALVLASVGDGLVFATGPGVVQALDAATGALGWAFRPGPDAPGGVWAVDGPAIANGVLFVGTAIAMGGNPNPSSSGMVYALRAATGEAIWATGIEGGVALGPSAVDDVVALAAGLGRGLYALDSATGEVAWYRPLRTQTPVSLAAAPGWLIVANQDGSVSAWQDLIG